jgi:hypothetical protein
VSSAASSSPVEVAGALQREAADKKQIVGQGRVLVPNAFVVELSATDLERFGEWDAPLRSELAGMVAEHAREQGWSFVGDVDVQFEQVRRARHRASSGCAAASSPPTPPRTARRASAARGSSCRPSRSAWCC